MVERQEKIVLAVVIPAYNEAGRIGATLEAIGAAKLATCRIGRIVVVDDGSTDDTCEVVRGFVGDDVDVQLIELGVNRGKGAAVKAGMLAVGECEDVDAILMSDADLATPIGEVDKLTGGLTEGCDVVIGSRDVEGSVLDPPRSCLRRVLAWGYRVLRRQLMLGGINDTQCGFKLFSMEAGRRIFEAMETEGFAFDCEVLGLAQKMGYRMKEVGVVWNEKGESKVRPMRDVVGMFVQLMKIRRRLKRL